MTKDDYQNYFAKAFRQFVINACQKQGVTAPMLARATGLSRAYTSKMLATNVPAPQPTLSTSFLVCAALGFESAKVQYAIESQLPSTLFDQLRIREKSIEVTAKTVNSRIEKPRIRMTVIDEEPVIQKPIDALALINAVKLKDE